MQEGAGDDGPHDHDHGGDHGHGGVTRVAVGAGLPERATLGCILLLLVVASLVSGGFLLHATDLHLPDCCEPWDAAIYPWNFLWAHDFAGAADGELLFTRRFYWPDGEGLGLYTPTWIYGVLSLPFQWLLPEPQSRHVAVAFLLWFSSVATALLAFAFARELKLPRGAALFAALLVIAASGRTMNAARLTLFCTEFLLLWLWTGWRFWRDGGAGKAAAWGGASALLLLQSQPLFFQAALCAALFLVVQHFRREGRAKFRALHRPFAAALLLFALLAGPFVWELLRELPKSPALDQSVAYTSALSLDVADLVRPNPVDRFGAAIGHLLPLRAASFFESGGVAGTASHFLGLGWIALLLCALFGRDGGARRMVGMALLLLLFAVGPVLKVAGHEVAPMPWMALQLVPPLAIEKSPTRLVWLVQVFAALAAARVVAGWLDGAKPGGGAWRRVAAGALVVATLAEQGDTVPLRSVAPAIRIPDAIAAMAAEPGDFKVLDVPFDGVPPCGTTAHGVNAFAMAFGAAHERGIFFGLYPRAARPGLAALYARPLFAAMKRIETLLPGETLPPLSADEIAAMRRDLAELEVGAVQVHDFAFIPARAHEREPLRQLFRQLSPRSETRLAPGNDCSITLFRY